MEKNKAILKSISMFIIYFMITMYGGQLLLSLGIKSDILRLLIKDVVFLAIIVTAYFDNLKTDFLDLKKRYTFFKYVKIILLGVLVLVITQFVIGMLVNFAHLNPPSNTKAIDELAKKSVLYTIFKTMIFAIIAEKLLFVESIRSFINNKWLFIITSALVLIMMNYIFTADISNLLLTEIVSQMIIQFVGSIAILIIYIQNKSNIILLMSIIFVYSFIPLLTQLLY